MGFTSLSLLALACTLAVVSADFLREEVPDVEIAAPMIEEEPTSAIDAELTLASTPDKLAALYEKFKALHRTDDSEVPSAVQGGGRDRFAVFQENVEYIQAENKRQSDFVLGVTPFTDLTYGEFAASYLMEEASVEDVEEELKDSVNIEDVVPAATTGLPKQFDWRSKKAVTPARSQGNCGSCWAFSSIAALETRNFVKTSKLYALSEQQMVDCASNNMWGNHRCSGGLPKKAYPWVKAHKGVASLNSYPYQCAVKTSKACLSSKCHNSKSTLAPVGGVFYARGMNQLMNAVVSKGAVTVLISVGQGFQHYKTGIMVDNACSKVKYNHAVTITGYGSTSTGAFWNVKNSWGAKWGQRGWVSMRRGINQCGVENHGVGPL